MTANWENLNHLKLVELRSFIDLFDGKKLDGNIKERKKRFEEFAKR
jgi:hypothetical protein